MEVPHREKLFRRAAIVFGSILLSFGFWGIAFPQYLFTGDCVRAVDEEGEDAAEETDGGNLYRKIGSAEPAQIEIRISILERTER